MDQIWWPFLKKWTSQKFKLLDFVNKNHQQTIMKTLWSSKSELKRTLEGIEVKGGSRGAAHAANHCDGV